MEDGIYFIDKPVGMTSFDVVRTLRKKYGPLKIGHAGTLDPLASGLLIVAVGKATKELSSYIKLPKIYEAEILVGESRNTGDMEGDIVAKRDVSALSEKKLDEILQEMIGTLEIPVPQYSAIKVGGEALYKKARRGENFEPPIKKMCVRAIQLNQIECEDMRCVISVVIDVESGTYIRSLAEEVGRRLGYPACIKNLRRISIGDYSVGKAENLDEI